MSHYIASNIKPKGVALSASPRDDPSVVDLCNTFADELATQRTTLDTSHTSNKNEQKYGFSWMDSTLGTATQNDAIRSSSSSSVASFNRRVARDPKEDGLRFNLKKGKWEKRSLPSTPKPKSVRWGKNIEYPHVPFSPISPSSSSPPPSPPTDYTPGDDSFNSRTSNSSAQGDSLSFSEFDALPGPPAKDGSNGAQISSYYADYYEEQALNQQLKLASATALINAANTREKGTLERARINAERSRFNAARRKVQRQAKNIQKTPVVEGRRASIEGGNRDDWWQDDNGEDEDEDEGGAAGLGLLRKMSGVWKALTKK
ncbi:hypothetical protein DM02DRAFT_704149 [Periconia macrospinosa]|uniref:Uncharacterized protein n=1 Tax=Periconia macrospinosa TaxID=97972 RepID=A0A2V1DY42_9PLEO|nr:hypothetical protein DM02DRAFT_704149 [Periconia macrospinosa]